MRVVCPYVEVHPETYRALPEHTEYRRVDRTDTAYADLLRELWADGRAFAIVEQDIVVAPRTLAEFEACPEPYCACPYAWTTHVGPALGCTRFAADLLERYPDAAEIAARLPSDYGPPGHWRQLDVRLMQTVLRDLYGLQPHCHAPVEHRNDEKQLVAGARVTVTVDGRSYLPDGLAASIEAELHRS